MLSTYIPNDMPDSQPCLTISIISIYIPNKNIPILYKLGSSTKSQ
jgi:hypothetical protein